MNEHMVQVSDEGAGVFAWSCSCGTARWAHSRRQALINGWLHTLMSARKANQ